MQLPGTVYSILTGGETEEQRQRQIQRFRERASCKCGAATVAYLALSPQTPPLSRGGSWVRSGASFCRRWPGSSPRSASRPRGAPVPSAELLESGTCIFQISLCPEKPSQRGASKTAVLGWGGRNISFIIMIRWPLSLSFLASAWS